MGVSGKHTTNIPPLADDSSSLVSQHNDCTCPHKSGKGRHKCDHCGKLDHKTDRCYALHGRPSRLGTIFQMALVQPSTVDLTSSSSDTLGQPTILNEFLKWYEDRQNFGSTVSVAHSSTSFDGLTRSISLGPWVLDSGTTNHIIGNKYFFFSMSTSSCLPFVTTTNGSRVLSHGVGTIHSLPSLSIDNVLYVSRYPFNLLSISRLTYSLDCVIYFTKRF